MKSRIAEEILHAQNQYHIPGQTILLLAAARCSLPRRGHALVGCGSKADGVGDDQRRISRPNSCITENVALCAPAATEGEFNPAKPSRPHRRLNMPSICAPHLVVAGIPHACPQRLPIPATVRRDLCCLRFKDPRRSVSLPAARPKGRLLITLQQPLSPHPRHRSRQRSADRRARRPHQGTRQACARRHRAGSGQLP